MHERLASRPLPSYRVLVHGTFVGLFEGGSRTVHYEISGDRIDDQFVNGYTDGAHGDPHPVVFVLSIDLGSH